MSTIINKINENNRTFTAIFDATDESVRYAITRNGFVLPNTVNSLTYRNINEITKQVGIEEVWLSSDLGKVFDNETYYVIYNCVGDVIGYDSRALPIENALKSIQQIT